MLLRRPKTKGCPTSNPHLLRAAGSECSEKGVEQCPSVAGWPVQTLREVAVSHADDGDKKPAPYGYGIDRYGILPEKPLADRKPLAKLDALYHKYGLDRICFYTSSGEGQGFQKPAGLSKAAPDRLGVVSTGTDLGSLGDQIWQPLADHFLDQVGRIRLGSARKQDVRLVFVDTQPTGEGPPARVPAPNYWHGFGMAHLGNEIVCGHDTEPQSCPVHIATRLALRHDDVRLG